MLGPFLKPGPWRLQGFKRVQIYNGKLDQCIAVQPLPPIPDPKAKPRPNAPPPPATVPTPMMVPCDPADPDQLFAVQPFAHVTHGLKGHRVL